MKRTLFACYALCTALLACASTTLPLRGNFVKPTDKNIQYVGRICFDNPERPRFTFPGTQVNARFTGTSLRLIAKPKSGFFMAQIDQGEPFKVAFMGERDSVVTLATALPQGEHEVRLMYVVEGYDLKPSFWGFLLDSGAQLLPPPALSSKTIEFIGNSITCGYGNESMTPADHFEYETENHYYSYAQIASRLLGAQAYVVARSGIGVYRCYGGAKEGTPENVMTTEYEYTNLYDRSERWDFSRYQPQVVCINLGTNDLSTNNYDINLFQQAYYRFVSQVRSHNPQAKIVLLCGSMLSGKELEVCRQVLDEVAQDAKKNGDEQVYRFDFTPIVSTPQNTLNETVTPYSAPSERDWPKYGADWHPSFWQHHLMANELTAYLQKLMNW